MLILAVDDEAIMLQMSEDAIREAAPDAELVTYDNPVDALEAVEEMGYKPDVAFSDIEMPDLSGLEFAIRLKKLSPNTRIVFVTGYQKYACDAFQVRAQGFVLKPLGPAAVKEELAQLPQMQMAGDPNKLRVQCFGHFGVFWKGEPVFFQRKQSKELFAYLIDRDGASCSAEEIAGALWEDEEDIHAAKSRIRLIIHDLRATLKDIGMDDVLIRERRQLAVRREMIDCDYWRMIHGDMNALNSYHGQYMAEYSWAELTEGKLFFREK